ncbi:hypothetical protein ACLI09_08680 [Flavobacterium sp. RHBU_24]|uniref:hypothetical protein n=1 Tax=Flavobacterium sp. RHBU_24 TaxID=3391185 RepID=UPI0039852E10
MRPEKISFGGDTSDIVYNAQDKPIEITTKEYNIAAPAAAPVITVYTIEYNSQGNAVKVSKSVDNQLELYYEIEYYSDGKLKGQSEFNSGGALVAYTAANYDSNILTSITTHKEDTGADVTSFYQYMNGNLVQKSVHNLYDVDSHEYYYADYKYTYLLDKENRINSYFDGPLGLLFLSNLSNQQSLQYIPNRINYQLFFAQETAYEKKMLKNIEIIAHRYGTSDTTNINYSYEYDTDGFPTVQRGTYNNITRRYVAAPGGGSVLLVTPYSSDYESTMNFYCN